MYCYTPMYCNENKLYCQEVEKLDPLLIKKIEKAADKKLKEFGIVHLSDVFLLLDLIYPYRSDLAWVLGAGDNCVEITIEEGLDGYVLDFNHDGDFISAVLSVKEGQGYRSLDRWNEIEA